MSREHLIMLVVCVLGVGAFCAPAVWQGRRAFQDAGRVLDQAAATERIYQDIDRITGGDR